MHLDLYRVIQKGVSMVNEIGLAQKHGYFYVINFGSDIKFNINEPHLIAEVLGRSNSYDSQRLSSFLE